MSGQDVRDGGTLRPVSSAPSRSRETVPPSRDITLDKTLAWCSFVVVCLVVLVSPWFFGAWEMWWFWPFTTLLFVASLLCSIRVVLGLGILKKHRLQFSPASIVAACSSAVFLAYAFVRMRQAPVFMDAERSFLLFFTPFILALLIVFSFNRTQLRTMYILVLLDLCALGLYGIINHWLTGSRMVLWVTTEYTQYAGRATGSYFCPDHFSGIMELLLALALGLLLGAGTDGLPGADKIGSRAYRILAAVLVPISICAVWLTQSRGGGLTVFIVLAISVLLWTARLQPATRWRIRLGCIVVFIGSLTLLWSSSSVYMARFKELFPFDPSRGVSFHEAAQQVVPIIKSNVRYNMYAGALRAWRDSPIIGIGPGMHQHLWFHYAASTDGDREKGIWPSRPNYDFHSYEVHNDWIQLLEEYGLIGAILFLAALCSIVVVLLRGFRRAIAQPIVLGALLAITCMALHSLVDFNLQIPATTWLFAVIIAIPFAWTRRSGT